MHPALPPWPSPLSSRNLMSSPSPGPQAPSRARPINSPPGLTPGCASPVPADSSDPSWPDLPLPMLHTLSLDFLQVHGHPMLSPAPHLHRATPPAWNTLPSPSTSTSRPQLNRHLLRETVPHLPTQTPRAWQRAPGAASDSAPYLNAPLPPHRELRVHQSG